MSSIVPLSTKAKTALLQAGFDPLIPQAKIGLYLLIDFAAAAPPLSPGLFPSDRAYRRSAIKRVRQWHAVCRLLERAKAADVRDEHLCTVAPNRNHGALDFTDAGEWRLIPNARAENDVKMEYREAVATALRSAIFAADKGNRRKYSKRRPIAAVSLQAN